MLESILLLSRAKKRAIALVVDAAALIFAFVLAMIVRFETLAIDIDSETALALVISIPISLFLFAKFGLYRAVVRFMALSALLVVCLGILSSAAALYLTSIIIQAEIPVSVVFNYALMSLVLIGGLRLLMRALYERKVGSEKHNVIIYGAGSAGRQLSVALCNGKEYNPICFVDDDPTLHHSTISGLPVCSPDEVVTLVDRYKAERVLLAIPSSSRSRRREILEMLEPIDVTVQTIPGMADMVDGKVSIDELEDVKIEDLLGRDPVEPQRSLMNVCLKGKNVLVTGAGGSIGSELCRQILPYEPDNLILVEVSEFNLYQIDRELASIIAQEELSTRVKPVLASVQDRKRLTELMMFFKIDTVYHAAAYKHVPMVEFNIIEGIRNNVFGTWNAAEAACAAGVSDFVLISTDKAVRPTNVMGASKRLSELVLQAITKRENNEVRFSMVRFGNVLGSSGSVIPLFREQIKSGGPLTVTHPDITRYFMTIPEAAQLVIQAGALGSLSAQEQGNQGGCVFVLDMGEPVKIDFLARKLIRLMGLQVKDGKNPQGDIEVVYSGLRPGEKLYEELLIGDNVELTGHPRIMTATEISVPWVELKQALNQLDSDCHALNIVEIHTALQQLPLGFTPSSGINDLMWLAR